MAESGIMDQEKGERPVTVDKKTLRRIFFGVAGCIILYWLLHETERVGAVWNFIKNVISPFVVGAAIAFILNVPMRGIERRLEFIKKKSIRRAIALVATIVLIVLVLVLVVRLVLPQVMDTIRVLIDRFPVFFAEAKEKVLDFVGKVPMLQEYVTNDQNFKDINWTELAEKIMGFVGQSATTIIGGLFSAIGSISSGVVDAVIAIVFAIYALIRKEILAQQFRRVLYAFLPEKFCDGTIRICRLTNKVFSNFISGQCLEACILGGMFAIAMSIFRMPYVALISMLIAVTALVPIVGAFVGCAVGAFFILVNDPMQAVWFVIMFLIIQQIEGNVIYPKVVGSSVGLPGMWVLLAVTVGGDLMGVAGMLLMIPAVSVLYTILRELTAIRLNKRQISGEKLQVQPAEFTPRPPLFKRKKKEPAENTEE